MAGMTYSDAGVDYGGLDAFKRMCQSLGAGTTAALAQHGVGEVSGVRGESAYLLETADAYWAHVEEGLGTKNLVADAVERLTGRCYYRSVGIDTVATIVNDMVTVGALPLSVAMHAGVGDADWFSDQRRAAELAAGFAEGCRLAGAAWGGGETPALRGLIQPGTIVLAGSSIGRISPKTHRITGRLADGDAIVFMASNGVQTNGLTLCRALADRLPDGYRTTMGDGRMYGESLLDASAIYVPFVAACQKRGITLKYTAHITGHGWRKLMRLSEPWVYRITQMRPIPELFRFIIDAGKMDLAEAYGTFNMGAGFAAYIAPGDVEAVLSAARSCGIDAWQAGNVVRQGDRKAVEIVPLGIEFDGSTMAVR
jgi:phosphoribosylformylglycinamidine cyclo-ligase